MASPRPVPLDVATLGPSRSGGVATVEPLEGVRHVIVVEARAGVDHVDLGPGGRSLPTSAERRSTTGDSAGVYVSAFVIRFDDDLADAAARHRSR